MLTIEKLLNDVKQRHRLKNDARLAEMMGVPRSHVSNARKDKTVRDDLAKKIAAALELDPLYVIACVKAEKAKDPDARKVWEEIAKEKAPGPPPLAANGHATEPLLPHAATTTTVCAACAIGAFYIMSNKMEYSINGHMGTQTAILKSTRISVCNCYCRAFTPGQGEVPSHEFQFPSA